MKHIARIGVVPHDRAGRVDGPGPSALAGACTGARSVERGDAALWSAQETVTRITGVNIMSGDRPCRVDGERECALAGACTRARSIECGDCRLRVNKGHVAEIQHATARAARGGRWNNRLRSRRKREGGQGKRNE